MATPGSQAVRPESARDVSSLQQYLNAAETTTSLMAMRDAREEPISCCAGCDVMLEACFHDPPKIHVRKIINMSSIGLQGSCPMCALLRVILFGPGHLLPIPTKADSKDLDTPRVLYSDTTLEPITEKPMHLNVYVRPMWHPFIPSVITLRFTFSLQPWSPTWLPPEKITWLHNTEENLTLFTHSNPLSAPHQPPLGLMDDPRKEFDQKLELARSWVKRDVESWNYIRSRSSRILDLLEQHTARGLFNNVYPTRLLDLSTKGEIRLVDCAMEFSDLLSSNQPLPAYVTLSHRWGTCQHLTLTTRTESRLKQGILQENLPQTFEDAAFTTREIGYRYIWIDALCIIQDSAEDWIRESVKMGDIFSGAVVTLAAHCATDDSRGFLSASLSKHSSVEFLVRGQQQVGICRQPKPELDITNSRLSKRGWVLEERLLSTRTIHFTQGQLYFETAKGIRDENGSLVRKFDYTGSREVKNISQSFSQSKLSEIRSLLGVGDVLEMAKMIYARRTTGQWLDLVEIYSRCDLTVDTDKLIAISGMALKIHQRTRQEWCAGIWKDFLFEGLLWFPTIEGLYRPSSRRAPSWSWASWDGPIQFPIGVNCFSSKRCEFVSLRNLKSERVDWLNGLGTLNLRGCLIPLSNLFPKDKVRLGPQPNLKRAIPWDISCFPINSLKHHVNVHKLYSEKLKTATDPAGWIAFDHPDNTDFSHESKRHPENETKALEESTIRKSDPCDLDLHFLILGSCRVTQHASFWGVFLKASDNRLQCPTFRRFGAGQLSRRYLDIITRDVLHPPLQRVPQNSIYPMKIGPLTFDEDLEERLFSNGHMTLTIE